MKYKLFTAPLIIGTIIVFGTLWMGILFIDFSTVTPPSAETQSAAAATTRFPIHTSKQYLYRAGDILPGLANPISGYVMSSNPRKTCKDIVAGASDGCVPQYNFYALTGPRSRVTQNGTTTQEWYPNKSIHSLSFWGSAGENYPNCSVVNGPVTSDTVTAPILATAYSKTRIKFTPGESYRFAPAVPKDPNCPAHLKAGGSFGIFSSAINNNPGLGLFTVSGNIRGASDQFWRGYGEGGQNGLGDNNFISGTFFNFMAFPEPATVIRPFSGSMSDPLKRYFRFESTESVYGVTTIGNKNEIRQAQQKTEIGLRNEVCIEESKKNPDMVCQFMLIKHSYIGRSQFDENGVVNVAISKANGAKYDFDPVQGGMPFVSLVLKESGVTSGIRANGTLYPIVTSRGAATVLENTTRAQRDDDTLLAKATFENLTFSAEMTFAQYLTIIRILAADLYTNKTGLVTTPETVPTEFIVRTFGSAWNIPDAVITARIGASQEVSNPEQEIAGAYMGGNYTMINLQALP